MKPQYFHGVLQYLRNLFPRKDYKLALKWKTKEFTKRLREDKLALASQIEHSFHLIDRIIFLDFLHDVLVYPTPPTQILPPQAELVKTCVKFIKRNSNSPISFAVSGGIPDTSDNGYVAYSRFVQIVKQFVAWGRLENITVILYRAFDSPSVDHHLFMTTGWWRLVENSSYSSTAEYIFEDKQSIAEREERKTPEALISQIEEEFKFDRQIVAVSLNPVLPPVDEKKQVHLNLSVIPTLLNTIGTRFSIVSLCGLHTIWRSLTPVVFASYNKHARTPLNIIYSLDLKEEMELDFTVDKIAEANQLFHNTVTKLQLVSARNATNLSAAVNLRKRLDQNQSTLQVKVGYVASIEACSGDDQFIALVETLDKEMMEFVDFVHFSYIPGLSPFVSYEFGLDRLVPQVVTRFENCKRRMGKIFPQVEVAFETGFLDTLKSREEDYVSLVLFWKEITNWATKGNTNVIMKGAFDSIDDDNKNGVFNRLGWWKVSENPNAHNELIIEEKRDVALQRSRPASGETGDGQEAGSIIVPLAVSISVVLAALIVVSVLIFKWKYSEAQRHNVISYARQLQLKNDDILILPRTSFNPESSTLIGTGQFGAVYKCYMPQLQSEVSVKTVSASTQLDESDKCTATKCLVSEIKIMSHVGHHENILRILGVCQEESLFLVTEYCVNGSLLSYLRSESQNDTVPSTDALLQFCMEIANGMDYLEQRKVIHGDLAARNVLLDATRSCKICDFGLSRKLELYDIYTKKGEEPLPWRWMALESLTDNTFSAKSDVWSMGVTFWEIFSLGKMPFPEMNRNEVFYAKLADGLRLEKPALCNDEIFDILISCWNREFKCRPAASEIVQNLLENIKDCRETSNM